MIDTGFERKKGPERLCVWSEHREQRQQIKWRYFLKVCVLPSIISLKRSCWNGCSQPLWESHAHLANIGSSKLVLGAFCPPRGSSCQVTSIVHSHKLFSCCSLAASSLQKVMGTSCHMSPQGIFCCAQKVGAEKHKLQPPKPQGRTRVLWFVYTEAGFAARFEPPTPPTVDTQRSPATSPILSCGLVRTKKLMFDSCSTQNH